MMMMMMMMMMRLALKKAPKVREDQRDLMLLWLPCASMAASRRHTWRDSAGEESKCAIAS
jgi:hypothetical protein